MSNSPVRFGAAALVGGGSKRMAFTPVETWAATLRPSASDPPPALLPPHVAAKVRTGSALLVALLLHLSLLILLLTVRERADGSDKSGNGAGHAMSLVELTEAEADPPAIAPVQPPSPASLVPTPATVRAAAEPPPKPAVQEWSVSKIPIAPASGTGASSSAPMPEAAGVPTASVAQPGSGAGDDDPLAGATMPHRKSAESNVGQIGAEAPSTRLVLDRGAVLALRAAVRREMPNARGTVTLELIIAPAGTVTSCTMIGTVEPALARLLQAQFFGARIFHASEAMQSARTVRLQLTLG